MSRLPVPGSDDGTWGGILNDYLSQSLNADGTLKTSATAAAGAEMTTNKGAASGYAPLDSSSKVPLANLPTDDDSPYELTSHKGTASGYAPLDASSKLPTANLPTTIPTANLGSGTADNTKFLRGDQTWTAPPTVADATASTKGIVQLAGDLSGTAASPTVPGLTTKVTSVTAADSTIIMGGTATAPTIKVGTIAENQVASLQADLGSKLTGITAGTGISVTGSAPNVTVTNAGVTSVNAQTGAVNIFPSFPPEQYGTIGGVDDATAINAAITTAAGVGGGIVPLKGIVYNVSQILIKTGVVLMGAGPKTVLKQLSSQNKDVVTGADTLQYNWVIRDLTLDGSYESNTSGGGITVNTAAGIYPPGAAPTDSPGILLDNVIVQFCAGDGFTISGSGSLGMQLIACRAMRNRGNGFTLTQSDAYLTACDAGENLGHAFFLNGGGEQKITNSKGWWSGRWFGRGVAYSTSNVGNGTSDGFHLTGGSDQQLIGCEAQDNSRDGFYIQNSSNNLLDGCYVDDNLRYHLTIDNSFYNAVRMAHGTGIRAAATALINIINGATTNSIDCNANFTAGFTSLISSGSTISATRMAISAQGGWDAFTASSQGGSLATGQLWAYGDAIIRLDQNLTVVNSASASNNLWPGVKQRYVLAQDATGGRTVTWGTQFVLPAGYVANSVANKADILDFQWNGTHWIGSTFATAVVWP